MNISTNSWHYKYWQWLHSEKKEEESPTVCGYWGELSFFTTVAIIFSPIALLVWVGDKLEKKFPSKPRSKKPAWCPFGKVQFIK